MAIENFTTYTELDSGDQIAVTSSRVTWTNLTRTTDRWVYKDKDAAHFSGDFEHLNEVYLDAADNYRSATYWALTNIVNDRKYITDNNGDELLVCLYRSGANYVSLLREIIAGTRYSDTGSISLDTLYYLKIKRDEAVGTYGTLYCYIYSDSGRTNLVDTLTVALHEKEDFQYIFSPQFYTDGSAPTTSGYVQNLDLQEAVAAVTRSFGFIIG